MNTLTSGEFPTAAELVARHHLVPSDLVVEVGSGDGSFLQTIRECGPRTIGFESDPSLSARALSAGIDTCLGELTPELARCVRRRYGCARLVVMASQSPVVQEAARLFLAPDGVLVLRTSAKPRLQAA